MNYIDKYNCWSKEARKELEVPYEVVTFTRLKEVIRRGHFIEKRQIFPQFTSQEIEFICLPSDLYDYVIGCLFDSHYKAICLDLTGYIWMDGYPVIYKIDKH